MEVVQDLAHNLSDATVVRRLRGGIVVLTVALVMAALFEKYDVSRTTRLWLFVPFFIAENAFFQAIYKTCGFSALRGVRHTDEGDERIADCRALSASRCAGRKQLLHSLIGAALLTTLFVWIG